MRTELNILLNEWNLQALESERTVFDKDGKKYISDGDVNRLIAGNSDNGGLQDVNNNHPSDRNDNIGFRLFDSDYLCTIYFLNPFAILPISSDFFSKLV